MINYTAPHFLAQLLSFYNYYLPVILFTVWAALSVYDLAKRADVTPTKGILWLLAIFLLPVVGAGAYLLVGKPSYNQKFRQTMVLGGLALLLLGILSSSLLRL